MAFTPDEKLMETVWANLPKSPDDNHVTFTEDDIKELWWVGFVDTKKYSTEEWLAAFEPHKIAENKYVFTKTDLLEKDKYRYRGPIRIPFEPFRINEGKYTDEGLQELIDLSIAPNCSKSAKEMGEFFEDFKNRHREGDELIRMDIQGKREISELVNRFPSPLRRLEILFYSIFTQEIAKIEASGGKVTAATPEQASTVQMSTFSTLPSSQSEKAAKELKSIEKSRLQKSAGTEDEGLEIGKMKKSRKGIRG